MRDVDMQQADPKHFTCANAQATNAHECEVRYLLCVRALLPIVCATHVFRMLLCVMRSVKKGYKASIGSFQ